MIRILMDHWHFVVAGVAVLFAATLLLQKKLKQRKIKKEQYEQRVKNQVLTEALKNNLGRKNALKKNDRAEPLERGDCSNQRGGGRDGTTVLKLVVTGDKTESYVVNPAEHVLLGREEGMNDIVLRGNTIAQQHCDIFSFGGNVYVRNLQPDYPITMKRRTSQIIVREQSVRILTGDVILVGSCQIQVMFMDYIGNVISG